MKTVDWRSFKIPPNMITLAVELHDQLVGAAVEGLKGVATPHETADSWWRAYQVKDIRNTTVLGQDGRHVRIRLHVPDSVVEERETAATYGLWLQLTGWLGKEILQERDVWGSGDRGELDLCANTELDPTDIWYMSERFTVVGAGIVKDMYDAGAGCLYQVLALSESAEVEDGRHIPLAL